MGLFGTPPKKIQTIKSSLVKIFKLKISFLQNDKISPNFYITPIKIHMKTMIANSKSLILTSFVNKIALRLAPTGRLKRAKKTPNFEKHFSVLDHFSPTIPESHP